MNKHDKNLTITVQTSQGNYEGTFLKTAKVQDVIDAVKEHFGFSDNGNYELRLETNPDEALEPQRTLVSYHIEDETVLVFTDLGIAV